MLEELSQLKLKALALGGNKFNTQTLEHIILNVPRIKLEFLGLADIGL